jgi:GTP-binding protein
LQIDANPDSYRDTFDKNVALYCFDEAVIYVRGGSGGHGSNSFKFGKGRQHLGPVGGSGGDGGRIILRVDPNVNSLRKFKFLKSFRAENGLDGDCEYANGMNARDLIVTVPPGTIVKDNATDTTLAVLNHSRESFVVAKGGRGGKGNAAWRGKGEKMVCLPPSGGERKWIKLELQLIADVGLIGVPNAGKSTLLNTLTNARPKIANYAFTTLVPNLGVCYLSHSKEPDNTAEEQPEAMMLADIPGLIEGAHLGAGLGISFLKHVERCEVLVHIVNGDSADPIQDYLTINAELISYSNILAQKPQIVVLNKIDLPHVAEKQAALLTALRAVIPHQRILAISAQDAVGLEGLKWKTWRFVQKIKQLRQPSEDEDEDTMTAEED